MQNDSNIFLFLFFLTSIIFVQIKRKHIFNFLLFCYKSQHQKSGSLLSGLCLLIALNVWSLFPFSRLQVSSHYKMHCKHEGGHNGSWRGTLKNQINLNFFSQVLHSRCTCIATLFIINNDISLSVTL